jgi:hypothetical protein
MTTTKKEFTVKDVMRDVSLQDAVLNEINNKNVVSRGFNAKVSRSLTIIGYIDDKHCHELTNVLDRDKSNTGGSFKNFVLRIKYRIPKRVWNNYLRSKKKVVVIRRHDSFDPASFTDGISEAARYEPVILLIEPNKMKEIVRFWTENFGVKASFMVVEKQKSLLNRMLFGVRKDLYFHTIMQLNKKIRQTLGMSYQWKASTLVVRRSF